MKKRFTFKCWNCGKTYTLLREITETQELIVACPFCEKEAIVKLEPFKRDVKSMLRGAEGEADSIGFEYDFPDVLPTEERTESQ
jgi:DNA-directed RNA polymerase subunit RPC12/RpoP